MVPNWHLSSDQTVKTLQNLYFPQKRNLKVENALSGSKLKVILRQKSWMKKSKLQATGLNYESAKRPKRFLNFLPPPISLGLSWRWLVMEIFYSASGHRLKHQHLFPLNHSVQRPLTLKTDYLPFIRFCPRNPQSWHFFGELSIQSGFGICLHGILGLG